MRKLLLLLAVTGVSLFVGAGSAHADETYYWKLPVTSDIFNSCGAGDKDTVNAGDSKYRGNYGYNRYTSAILVNGGYWRWGALYTDIGSTIYSNSQTGTWYRNKQINNLHPANPFIENMSQYNIQAWACFSWYN